jgi:hypothetical protein
MIMGMRKMRRRKLRGERRMIGEFVWSAKMSDLKMIMYLRRPLDLPCC